ncbi:MAG: threonine synthase [Chitinophagaceae bacterium]|nr:threonine synthase [Chitinophagaceae bacterium]
MQFYSLNKKSDPVSFREATIAGQAPDKGLYFPEHIPVFGKDFFASSEKRSDIETAFQVIRPYAGDSIPDTELYRIVEETLSFPIPLVKLSEDVYTLELFHGPTLAFKDVGARFMSRCLGYFSKESSEKVTVLVATSGDTGGAVADGFYEVPGVEVVILYPSGKVSPVQEKQLTTLGKNIRALEVNGNFDDCQALVKKAFADTELKKSLFLTSANSINVARWLPQQFYYFSIWRQWVKKDTSPIISVPSGNFGNICAGMLAHQSGLPVKHFIAACNENDVVTRFLQDGAYQPKTAVPTISNAMDVGDPSNFIRIMELFDQETEPLKDILSSYRFTDDQTREAMERLYKEYGYMADPHGAVGFLALEAYCREHGKIGSTLRQNFNPSHPTNPGVFLETAHPVKFPDEVEKAIKKTIPWPDSIKALANKEKQAGLLEPVYEGFRDYLLRHS